MPRQDTELRERVRSNVGHAFTAWPVLTPAAKSRRTLFRGARRLPPGVRDPDAPENGDGVPPPPPPPFPEAPPGLAYCLTLVVPTATRELIATPRIGVPYLLRHVMVSGDVTIASAFSFRLLDSDDPDTTAVVDPTGSDIVEFAGDAAGAEDPGLHAALSTGPLHFEPWYRRGTAGGFIKLKTHNVSGGTLRIAVFLDLDEILP